MYPHPKQQQTELPPGNRLLGDLLILRFLCLPTGVLPKLLRERIGRLRKKEQQQLEQLQCGVIWPGKVAELLY